MANSGFPRPAFYQMLRPPDKLRFDWGEFKGEGHEFGGEEAKKAADATWKFFDQHLNRPTKQ
jgi:hypothetical protein